MEGRPSLSGLRHCGNSVASVWRLCIAHKKPVKAQSVALFYPGLTFSLNEEPIPNNNMARISVNDTTLNSDGNGFDGALVCRSELTEAETNQFTHGYLQADGNSPITGGNGPNIPHNGPIERGWDTRRDVADNHRLHYLRRHSSNAEEGFYNCHIQGDLNTPVGLYILHPSESPSSHDIQ